MAWSIEVNQGSVPMKLRLPQKFIYRVALSALRKIKQKGGKLSLGFVGPARMRVLNMEYRGENKVTDVISLPLMEGAPLSLADETYWGEVIVCPSEAQKQAHLFGNSFKKEIARLIVHGILHIAGYDHEKPREAHRMLAVTDTILSRVR